jgi:hypothetical protein
MGTDQGILEALGKTALELVAGAVGEFVIEALLPFILCLLLLLWLIAIVKSFVDAIGESGSCPHGLGLS